MLIYIYVIVYLIKNLTLMHFLLFECFGLIKYIRKLVTLISSKLSHYVASIMAGWGGFSDEELLKIKQKCEPAGRNGKFIIGKKYKNAKNFFYSCLTCTYVVLVHCINLSLNFKSLYFCNPSSNFTGSRCCCL